MTIKTNDHDYQVVGEGQGTYNTVAGSLGLASFLGFNAGGLFGMNGRNGGYCGDYVTRAELELAQRISAKDSEIALLRSEQNTEIKIADVYERIMKRVNADKDEQSAINTRQAVYNATANGAIATLNNQVHALMALTKIVIPSDNICPKPMPLYNSWVAPVGTTTEETPNA